jgi:hypothetical protein
VQRALEDSTTPAPKEPAQDDRPPETAEESGPEKAALDLEQIADQLYPLVMRKLEIEKERYLGRRW